MSVYLNDMLYQKKMFDSFDKISLLERFMYTSPPIDPVKSFARSTALHETSLSATSRPVTTAVGESFPDGTDSKSAAFASRRQLYPTSLGTDPIRGLRWPSNDLLSESNPSLALRIPSRQPDTRVYGCLQVTPVKDSPVKDSIVYPKHDDTLFWCAYIAKYEYGDYLAIGTKYKNKEIEKKQELINMIRKTPAMLKGGTRKITNVAIQEILAELMIDKKTSMQSFYAICVLYKLQVFMVDVSTNTYMNIGVEDSNDKFIVYRSESLNSISSKSDHNMGRRQPSKDGMYSIDLDTTQSKIDKITADMLEIESGHKPIKGISSYKVDELEAMANKIGICFSDSKMKKPELYALILNKCEWV